MHGREHARHAMSRRLNLAHAFPVPGSLSVKRLLPVPGSWLSVKRSADLPGLGQERHR